MFMCRSWIREWSDLIAEQHPAASPLEKRDVSSVLCCSVEGPFPQSTAQSVRSSGRDDRWGLGGNVTTHFTGKGGSGSSDFSHLLGFFFFLYLHDTCGLLERRAAHGGRETRLLHQHFQRSLNLQPNQAQLPGRSAVRLPLALLSGRDKGIWGRYCGTLRTRLEGEGSAEDGGVYLLSWSVPRWPLPLSADALPSAEG